MAEISYKAKIEEAIEAHNSDNAAHVPLSAKQNGAKGWAAIDHEHDVPSTDALSAAADMLYSGTQQMLSDWLAHEPGSIGDEHPQYIKKPVPEWLLEQLCCVTYECHPTTEFIQPAESLGWSGCSYPDDPGIEPDGSCPYDDSTGKKLEDFYNSLSAKIKDISEELNALENDIDENLSPAVDAVGSALDKGEARINEASDYEKDNPLNFNWDDVNSWRNKIMEWKSKLHIN